MTRRTQRAASLLAALVTGLSGTAWAQQAGRVGPADPDFDVHRDAANFRGADRGFGNRGAFVFSVEKVLGYFRQEFGPANTLDLETLGVQTVFWGHLGLFGVLDSGLSLGGLLGLSRIGESELTIVRIGPRVGYAGSLRGAFGYWLRLGPSAFLMFNEGSGLTSAFALSGEIYAVFTPVSHLGILVGPTGDMHLAGTSEFTYSSYGFGAGLFGEFW